MGAVESCAERVDIVQVGSDDLDATARDVFRFVAVGVSRDGADLPLVVLGEAVEH